MSWGSAKVASQSEEALVSPGDCDGDSHSSKQAVVDHISAFGETDKEAGNEKQDSKGKVNDKVPDINDSIDRDRQSETQENRGRGYRENAYA